MTSDVAEVITKGDAIPVPEFLARLRRHVGTDLLWLSGVSAVVIDSSGDILLTRRADTRSWALVAGILEPGEPAPAVAREVYEETGVRVLPETICSVYAEPPVTYPNGDQAQYLDTAFRCRVLDGEARVNDDESLEVGWFNVEGLPPLAETDHRKITMALQQRCQPWFVGPTT